MSKEYKDVVKDIYNNIGLTDVDSKQFLDNHVNLELDPEYNKVIDSLLQKDKELKKNILSPELLNKLATLQSILISKNNKLEKYIKELDIEKQSKHLLQEQLKLKINEINQLNHRIEENKLDKEFDISERNNMEKYILELKEKLFFSEHENKKTLIKLEALQKAINDKLDVINPYLAEQKNIIRNKYYKYKNKYQNLKNKSLSLKYNV
jgi:hypothetical protein